MPRALYRGGTLNACRRKLYLWPRYEAESSSGTRARARALRVEFGITSDNRAARVYRSSSRFRQSVGAKNPTGGEKEEEEKEHDKAKVFLNYTETEAKISFSVPLDRAAV